MEPDKFHRRSTDQEQNQIHVDKQSKDVIDQNIVDTSTSSSSLTDFFHFDTDEHDEADLWVSENRTKDLPPYTNPSGLPWTWDGDDSQSIPYDPGNCPRIDNKNPISNITYDFKYPSGIVDNLSVEIQDKHTSVSAASENKPVAEASSATMGSILFNGKFKCTEVACANKTFGRRAELQRHHATIHAVEKWFWCPVPSCSRSKEPFARKDKLADHVRNIHEA
ncbi:hypothetical protein IQ07DRAFT_344733 [Pyrenochaeta sp. DS3sAY3a]|nr:hypothetical protein IQ07DRAFT_344733 [Pyrenochaeta sp. DS3sAY3a]